MGRQGVGKPTTTTVAPASGVEGKRAPNPRWTSRKQGTNSGWTNQGIRRENTGKPEGRGEKARYDQWVVTRRNKCAECSSTTLVHVTVGECAGRGDRPHNAAASAEGDGVGGA